MLSPRSCLAAAGLTIALASTASAGQKPPGQKGCDELFGLPGLVWRGTSSSMTIQQFAAYAAPIFWLSPDEPTLQRRSGRDMRVPAAFPFEAQPESPVIYYQVTQVADLPNTKAKAITIDPNQKGQSVLNFDVSSVLYIKYIAYFPEEAGVGGHLHDVEPTEFRIVVGRANGSLARELGYICNQPDYLAVVQRVTGEAHGNRWYYNVLEVDKETAFPIRVLVEEGKHASAPDKNADGYFTPGYDVSRRTNDAWGVRDTIRGGSLFSGKYEAWMVKVRRPEYRVVPPLPLDSPLLEGLAKSNVTENAVYELRPYPSPALATDPLLQHKIKEKETQSWPVEHSGGFSQIRESVIEGRDLKPFSVAYRFDGQAGFSVAFPLLVVKNVPEPLSGGYIVNRMYFRGDNLQDWGWMAMYTPSASRWFDKYLAAGMETEHLKNPEGIDDTTRTFVAEAGFKLRFRAPNRFLGFFTEFWGFRTGVRSLGAMDIDGLSYVLEIGAGVW